MAKLKDKCKVNVGDRFTRLEIVEIISVRKVKVVCDCGKEKVVRKYALLCDKHPTKSCGCLRKEVVSLARKEFPESAITKIKKKYTKGSFDRNIVFELSEKTMMEIVNKPCIYCGTWYSNKVVTWTYVYLCNGIDRVDSKKGYVEGNCVPCCKFCNIAKSSYSADFFIEMCKKVANNNKD